MPSRSRKKILGLTGDVNALDYGGGVVFDQGHGPEWWFWDPPEEDESGQDRYTVYRTNVPKDVFDYYSWADPEKVADVHGEDPDYIVTAGSSRDVIERALVMGMISDYYGPRNLDDYPENYTRAEMERRFGPTYRAFRRGGGIRRRASR